MGLTEDQRLLNDWMRLTGSRERHSIRRKRLMEEPRVIYSPRDDMLHGRRGVVSHEHAARAEGVCIRQRRIPAESTHSPVENWVRARLKRCLAPIPTFDGAATSETVKKLANNRTPVASSDVQPRGSNGKAATALPTLTSDDVLSEKRVFYVQCHLADLAEKTVIVDSTRHDSDTLPISAIWLTRRNERKRSRAAARSLLFGGDMGIPTHGQGTMRRLDSTSSS